MKKNYKQTMCKYVALIVKLDVMCFKSIQLNKFNTVGAINQAHLHILFMLITDFIT